jgi:hypothetical protein
MHEEKNVLKDKLDDTAPPRVWPRTLAVVVLFALIAFVGSDGYFNEWKTFRRLRYWNVLELKDRSDSTWQLTAHRDFTLLSIADIRSIAVPESLVAFDRPYHDSGFYRIYFRLSDTSSPRLQKMADILARLDTGHVLSRSVENAKKALRNLGELLGRQQQVARDTIPGRQQQVVRDTIPGRPQQVVRDTIPPRQKQVARDTIPGRQQQVARDTIPPRQKQLSRDTIPSAKRDTPWKLSRGIQSLGTEEEAIAIAKKIATNPQFIIGLGLGIAASTGIDMLRGNAFCAMAKNDVFRVDSMKAGARTGRWEGSPIDILWVLRPTQ